MLNLWQLFGLSTPISQHSLGQPPQSYPKPSHKRALFLSTTPIPQRLRCSRYRQWSGSPCCHSLHRYSHPHPHRHRIPQRPSLISTILPSNSRHPHIITIMSHRLSSSSSSLLVLLLFFLLRHVRDHVPPTHRSPSTNTPIHTTIHRHPIPLLLLTPISAMIQTRIR